MTVTPDMPEYALLRDGKEVEPRPSGARKAAPAKGAAAATSAQPAWAKPAQSEGAKAAAASPPPPPAGNPNRPAWAK